MKFGDPKVVPLHSNLQRVLVTNGLHYSEHWQNGGGYKVIYDRTTSRAYYHSASR